VDPKKFDSQLVLLGVVVVVVVVPVFSTIGGLYSTYVSLDRRLRDGACGSQWCCFSCPTSEAVDKSASVLNGCPSRRRP